MRYEFVLKKLKKEDFKLSEINKSPNRWLDIAEPFKSSIMYIKENLDNIKFMNFLKSQLGCLYSRTMIIINTQELKLDSLALFLNAGILYEVLDRETNNTIGYTSESLIELYAITNQWRKEYEPKIKIKMENVKELIKPVNFSESNKTLKGGQNADDLRVFNDNNVSVSCWKLTFFGLLKLLITRKVWLGIMAGSSQPPVWVSISYPFKK